MLTDLVLKCLERSLFQEKHYHTAATSHALPLTEHGAKWVRLQVLLIALLLIYLDFKVFEVQVSFNTRYYHKSGDTTNTSGSTVYNEACHTFKMIQLFSIDQISAKLNLD